LPPDLTYGAYRILDLSDGAAGSLYEGKVILDKTYGHAAYGCALCCNFVTPFMEFNPLSVGTNATSTQQVEAGDSCGGGNQTITEYFPDWWTDNTAIATANRNVITGVSAGTTNHHAESEEMYWGRAEYFSVCPLSQQQPSAPTNVQVPTSLKVVSATILQTGNSGNHGCTSGYYGIGLDIDYQVLDQNSSPIASSAMTPQEYIVWYDGTNNGGFTNIGPTYVSTTSQTTRVDGTFDDAPVELCKAVPFTTPLTSTQTIQILMNGKAYQVRTNNWKFSSTNLTNHGTVTNGGDVNKTQ
jgi:hypothetical protein